MNVAAIVVVVVFSDGRPWDVQLVSFVRVVYECRLIRSNGNVNAQQSLYVVMLSDKFVFATVVMRQRRGRHASPERLEKANVRGVQYRLNVSTISMAVHIEATFVPYALVR
jgi:hypothetical protein